MSGVSSKMSPSGKSFKSNSRIMRNADFRERVSRMLKRRKRHPPWRSRMSINWTVHKLCEWRLNRVSSSSQ